MPSPEPRDVKRALQNRKTCPTHDGHKASYPRKIFGRSASPLPPSHAHVGRAVTRELIIYCTWGRKKSLSGTPPKTLHLLAPVLHYGVRGKSRTVVWPAKGKGVAVVEGSGEERGAWPLTRRWGAALPTRPALPVHAPPPPLGSSPPTQILLDLPYSSTHPPSGTTRTGLLLVLGEAPLSL